MECSLGGLAHALKLPFTALYVGGGSMFCILLIARYVEAKKIFQALTSILSIKFLLNPHSPIGAYLAVSFQAFLGYVLFRCFPFFRLNAILLFCLGFLESAFQKVLILSFLYGRSLYKALDKVLQDFSSLLNLDFTPNTFSLFALYVLFYGLAGLLMGLGASKYVLFLEQKTWQTTYKLTEATWASTTFQPPQRKHKRIYFSLLFLFLLLAFLHFSGEKISWLEFMLSVLAILFWFSGALGYLLLPLLKKQSWRQQKEIIDFLPQIRAIWYLSKERVKMLSFPRNVFVFLHIFVISTLFVQSDLPFQEQNDK